MSDNKNVGLRKNSGFKPNLLRTKAIAIKFLKTSVRDKPMYFWTFGYPILFMLIYLVAFGGGNGETTYNIGFLNNDGIAYNGQQNDEIIDFSSIFLIDLFNPNNEDSNLSDTFISSSVESETLGIKSIQNGELDAVIIIPNNFSEIMFGEIVGTPELKIITSPDPFEKSIIPSVISNIVNDMILQYNNVEKVDLNQSTTGGVFSVFDWMMPGIVIAGITVAIMNVATLFTKEKESGAMERLDTTPVPRSVQIIGGASAQMIFSFIQAILLIGCLFLFGVNISSSANWFTAILMVIVTAYMCIGIGMIIASIMSSADTAGGISWVVILPLQFFGGTIMSLGDSAFNRSFPTWYSVRAMRNSLVDGLSTLEILPDIGIVFLYGTVFLIIAIIIFTKKTRV